MEYRDLLVHVDNSKACEVRMKFALALAKQQGAHLTVLFSRKYGPDFDKAAEESKQRFEQAVAGDGAKVEWRIATQRGQKINVIDSLVMNAHYADLLVLGQYDANASAFGVPADLAEHVMLQAGRPVLIVPYTGKYETVGENVLVAWNGSREAVRAVNDAIPLMMKAKTVTVLALNPDQGDGKGHGEIPCADICLHLARHGVNAKAQHLVAKDIDAGNMLLSMAADEGVDLLVMGGYGQPRLREVVLGGATRQILRHMTVPVLMAH